MRSKPENGIVRRVIWKLFTSGRPMSSAIAGLLTAATIAFLPHHGVASIFRAGIAFTLITMAGFIWNDVHDRDKDRLKQVRRPITVGSVSVRQAILFSAVLCTVAVLLSPNDEIPRLILFATILALIGYSYFAYAVAPLKGVYTAGLCCTPLIYGISIGGGHPRASTLIALCIFIIGRETYLDVLDFETDHRFGLRTIPAFIGPRAAEAGGTFLMLLSIAASILFVHTLFSLACVSVALSVLSLVLFWPGVDLHTRIKWTRLPMLFGALALASASTF